MPTLIVQFPGGRYHATPWGHHVNEGLVEWPPSPWRLLRALIATGYATQGWARGLPPSAQRLIESLARVLPRYRLPRASLAHSRHYMPLGVLDKGREKTTLVFDAWANVGDGVLAARWDCALDEEASTLFGLLVRNLGYLGRSESWVVGEPLADHEPLPEGRDAFPHVGERPRDPGWEQVSLMAPEVPESYAHWREQAVKEALEKLPLPEGKKRPPKNLVGKRMAAEAPYPADLAACVQQDTAAWKRHGWSQPPGSRRVLYWRPTEALVVAAPVLRARSEPPLVEAMLLALTPVKGKESALPRRTRTLAQAELLHRALVARASPGLPCPELSGKDEQGQPLTGHRHAHILPLDLDSDGHLDHVLIHAPMGLGGIAQNAVRDLRRTWTKGGVGELRVAVAGLGTLESLLRLPSPFGSGMAAVLGPPGGAKTWISATPFVPPRHLKRSGKNCLEGQLRAELVSRGLPAGAVNVIAWNDGNRELRHAVRVRRHPAPPPPVDVGFIVRLELERPVSGPLVLGYGAHFGLGLFVAAG